MKSILLFCILLLSSSYSQTPVTFSINEKPDVSFDLDVSISTPDTLAAVYLQLGFAKGLLDSMTSMQAPAALPDMEYSSILYTGDKDKDYVVLMATMFDQDGNEKAMLEPGTFTIWSLKLGDRTKLQNVEIVSFAEASRIDASMAPVKVNFSGQNITDVDQKVILPSRTELLQNYPNPFNDATMITFRLDAGSQVKLELFNSNGQLVAVLGNGSFPAGEHTVQVPTNLSSGIFFYRLKTERYIITRKMSKLR